MTITEAEQIFDVWRQWYWPTHIILESIFLGCIPESFLPYSQDILEEALNIVAKQYHDSGDYQTSNHIQTTIASLFEYENDEKALKQAADMLSNPELMEVFLLKISRYKMDWQNWLKKQEKLKE